jgi:hypothetical protein
LCPLIYEVLERLLFVKREILKAFLLVANFCTPSKARECVQELLRRPPPVQLALLKCTQSSQRKKTASCDKSTARVPKCLHLSSVIITSVVEATRLTRVPNCHFTEESRERHLF